MNDQSAKVITNIHRADRSMGNQSQLIAINAKNMNVIYLFYKLTLLQFLHDMHLCIHSFVSLYTVYELQLNI